MDARYTLYILITEEHEISWGCGTSGSSPMRVFKMNENTLKNDSVVSLQLHARLDDREEAQLSLLLKEKIERYGKVRVLLVLENYPAADSAKSFTKT